MKRPWLNPVVLAAFLYFQTPQTHAQSPTGPTGITGPCEGGCSQQGGRRAGTRRRLWLPQQGHGKCRGWGQRQRGAGCLCSTAVQLCPALNQLLLVSERPRSRWEEEVEGGDFGKWVSASPSCESSDIATVAEQRCKVFFTSKTVSWNSEHRNIAPWRPN